ncbi:cytochrome-c peroxidase [Capnocytophaga stomatis]|uniref:Cytochrome-c peroxidase n=2 Tax=Capnocytophaga stomatis TaxID=1848904 RepID=A0ABW8QBM2_9FLAO|nr:cytochrome c peroxidase [Capnocytophaga stomatis]GIJ93598.1 methylamine utilization protein [Capnocytophaga stomatis]
MRRIFIFLSVFSAFAICKSNENLNRLQQEEDYIIIESYKKPINQWPKPTIDDGVEWTEMAPIETDMDYYKNLEKPDVQLGMILFFDPKLSASNQISCSTCHHPEMGWTTHTKKAVGHDHLEGSRNTQSILNVASKNTFFWDGRASSLEEQALGPIGAHNEMNMNIDLLPGKLQKIEKYRELFDKAFHTKRIKSEHILKALAAFQRTVKSQASRVDKFMQGDFKSLTNQEIKGLHIFRTKGRCMNCHNGQYLTDEKFHNIGLTYYKRKYEDLGRYNITKNPDDVGRFLTPSLRDLLNTRPWMHNGFFDDLTGIVNMYNSGMQVVNPTPEEKTKDPLHPVVDPLMKPLNLTSQEIKDLVAFLEALNGTKFKMPRPEIPR